MKPRFAATLLLAGAALLSSGEVAAQVRGAAPQTSRNTAETLDSAARVAQLDAWLRRLMGNFRVGGTLYDDGRIVQGTPYAARNNAVPTDDDAPMSSTPKGSMQCLGIGAGPGVHCLVDVNWREVVKDARGFRAVDGFSEVFNTLHPAMMLFAVNPDKVEVQLMLVDDQGNADTWSGPLSGDTVTFEPSDLHCWGETNLKTTAHCPRRIQVTAKPGSGILTLDMRFLRFATRFLIDLKLHRLPDDKARASSKGP